MCTYNMTHAPRGSDKDLELWDLISGNKPYYQDADTATQACKVSKYC